MKLKIFCKELSIVLCGVFMLGAIACSTVPVDNNDPDGTDDVENEISVCLMVDDTYDFGAMGYTVADVTGSAIAKTDDVIKATEKGESNVTLKNANDQSVKCTVTVYQTAEELGSKWSFDKGMFFGKKIIVFGDSITDGVGCARNRNYFAKICTYLGASSDPTDIENINFALSGSCIAYGGINIGGAERVAAEEAFEDDYGQPVTRNPRPNILDADLCVIFYGTNDFTLSHPIVAPANSGITDTPATVQATRTVKGGFYFMVNKIRELNPNIKFLLLPPIYRADLYGNSMYEYNEDRSDVKHAGGIEWLSSASTAVQSVAEDEGCKFVDWYHIFNYENFAKSKQYSFDRIHPNDAGHELMFNYLIENIK